MLVQGKTWNVPVEVAITFVDGTAVSHLALSHDHEVIRKSEKPRLPRP